MSSASFAYERTFEGLSLKDLDRIIFDPNQQYKQARVEALKEAYRILGPKKLEERIKGNNHYLSIAYHNRRKYVQENTLRLYKKVFCQKAFAK